MTRDQKKRFKYIAKLCHMDYATIFQQVGMMAEVTQASLKEINDYLVLTTFPMILRKDYSELFGVDFVDTLMLDLNFVVTELYHKDPLKYWRQYKYIKTL